MAQETAVIERRTIDFVPESERHGKVFSMFTLFFSGNMQITAVAVGVIPIELGLSLWWSVFAVVLGNILGGFVMAAAKVGGQPLGGGVEPVEVVAVLLEEVPGGLVWVGGVAA